MIHEYRTDYGPVRVSEMEAAILAWGQNIPRAVSDLYPNEFGLVGQIKADCERVARWKFDHA